MPFDNDFKIGKRPRKRKELNRFLPRTRRGVLRPALPLARRNRMLRTPTAPIETAESTPSGVRGLSPEFGDALNRQIPLQRQAPLQRERPTPLRRTIPSRRGTPLLRHVPERFQRSTNRFLID